MFRRFGDWLKQPCTFYNGNAVAIWLLILGALIRDLA